MNYKSIFEVQQSNGSVSVCGFWTTFCNYKVIRHVPAIIFVKRCFKRELHYSRVDHHNIFMVLLKTLFLLCKWKLWLSWSCHCLTCRPRKVLLPIVNLNSIYIVFCCFTIWSTHFYGVLQAWIITYTVEMSYITSIPKKSLLSEYSQDRLRIFWTTGYSVEILY